MRTAQLFGAGLFVFELGDWRQVLRGDPCAYCGRASEAIDHIEPQKLGGLSEFENFTAACHSCNSAKRARSLLTYLLAKSQPKPKTNLDSMLSFVLPNREYVSLRRQAKRNHRTVSQEIRRGIDWILEDDKREAA